LGQGKTAIQVYRKIDLSERVSAINLQTKG